MSWCDSCGKFMVGEKLKMCWCRDCHRMLKEDLDWIK